MHPLEYPDAYNEPADGGLRLPRNVEAEAALLGAMMIDNRLADDIGDPLDGEHFYEPVHGRVFALIKALRSSDKLANPITMAPMLGGDAGLLELGGVGYLAELTAGGGAGLIGARQFAKQIYDLAVLRSLAEVGRKLVESDAGREQAVR